jgi:hypothetical protein
VIQFKAGHAVAIAEAVFDQLRDVSPRLCQDRLTLGAVAHDSVTRLVALHTGQPCSPRAAFLAKRARSRKHKRQHGSIIDEQLAAIVLPPARWS